MRVQSRERLALVPRPRAGLRLAVISTPRSGNTWLRHLLAAGFGLEQQAVHNPAEIDWQQMPKRHVVQLHWHPTEELIGQLREHSVQTVTLSRHPLSVLISILHFAPNHPNTARWLEGEGGNESSILGVLPRSRAFVDWACGPRARALLSVTRQWWQRDEAVKVRYEDLYRDPLTILRWLAERLGVTPVRPLEEAVDIYSLPRIQDARADHHAWKASPDLWRLVLPRREAEQIAAAQRETFETLGYACDADAALEDGQADLNWLNAEFAAIWEQLHRARSRIAWLVEQQERRQLGITGRLRKSLVERFPRLAGALKRRIRGDGT